VLKIAIPLFLSVLLSVKSKDGLPGFGFVISEKRDRRAELDVGSGAQNEFYA